MSTITVDLEAGLQKRYFLSRAARVRPEKFGGLAYTFHDQKLYFIAPPLMPFVKCVEGETVGEVVARMEAESGKKLSRNSLAAILVKLEELKEKGVLDER
jgi:putative mycofactocin binding protein MftB